jgi:hypothetical protein
MYQNQCGWKRISSLHNLWDSDKGKTLYFITCAISCLLMKLLFNLFEAQYSKYTVVTSMDIYKVAAIHCFNSPSNENVVTNHEYVFSYHIPVVWPIPVAARSKA